MKRLAVHPDGRRLITADGGRIYLIGDTAWELFHRLDDEQTEHYLTTRAEQGFNLIQAVALAELNGLQIPDRQGMLPLFDWDPTRPNPAYFDRLARILGRAAELGLYMGILPTWGDKFNRIWGAGPEVFDPDNAYIYGRFLGERLREFENVVWILGGDRPLTCPRHHGVIDGMARGLREGDGGKFLLTFHPCGNTSSSALVGDRDWIDFHMLQSGHSWPRTPCYELMAADWARTPQKPVMDGEPCYEDHPVDFDPRNGYYDGVDTRLAAYRNLLSGACGNTYGHHAVWQMNTDPSPYCPNRWQDVLRRPGAENIRLYRQFVEQNDFAALHPVCDAVADNRAGALYVAAMAGEGEAVLYLPTGGPVALNLPALGFTPARCRVFEPETGEYHKNALLEGDRLILPGRAAGRGRDAVVFLQA